MTLGKFKLIKSPNSFRYPLAIASNKSLLRRKALTNYY